MPLVETQDQASARPPRDRLGLPASGVRPDLGVAVKRAGCCGNCDGFGSDASAPETGGLCWDCRGTGHAHLGRCRSPFLDWWHLKEGAVVWTAMIWTIVTTLVGIPLFPPATYVWAPFVSVGPALLAILAMILLGRAADNQIRRYGLPPLRKENDHA